MNGYLIPIDAQLITVSKWLETTGTRFHGPVVCVVGDQPLMRADWDTRVILPGETAAFIRLPQGGDGGSNPIAIVATIALAIVAPYAGAALAGAMGVTAGWAVTGITAAVFVGGSMLINAVLPPDIATGNRGQSESPSPTYNLNAQQNQARLGEPIPVQYGRMLRYPDLAAEPYWEYHGNEQYLYQLLCLGQGEFDIEEIRIGETEISNFEEIDYEVVPPGAPVMLFPDNVHTSVEVSGTELDGTWTGPFVTNPAGTTTDRIAIDLVLPKGLGAFDDEGGLGSRTVEFSVEARMIDDNGNALGSWVELNAYDGVTGGPYDYYTMLHLLGSSFYSDYLYLIRINPVETQREINGATVTPQRHSYDWFVPDGRYEVRVMRVDTKSTDSKVLNDLYWAGLRSYLPSTRFYGNATMVAMRMKASQQLSGQAAQKIGVICTRKLPIWYGSSWSAPTATRSIAWALADACRAEYGPELTDSRIDLDALLALDAVWAARGDYLDGVFENRRAFWQALTEMAKAGRTQPMLLAGNVSFKRDQAQTVVKAAFTPRNIKKGSFSVDYVLFDSESPDDVVVEFFNSTTWTWDEVTAALAGSSSERPARIRRMFITDRNQAYREGCYEAACNADRRIFASFQTEMDGRILTRGDLISVSHDVPQWGYGGEILAVSGQRLTLSEPIAFTSGETHYIGLRKSDGSLAGPYQVTEVSVSNTQVDMVDAVPSWIYTGRSRERTHFQFGPGGRWSKRCLVVSARPRGMDTIEILAVSESAAVHTADQGSAPAPQTSSLLPGVSDGPAIGEIRVTQTWDQLTPILNISWRPAPGADRYVIQRRYGSAAYRQVAETTDTAISISAPKGSASIRVAAIGRVRGPWATWSGTVGTIDLPPVTVSGLTLRDNYEHGDAYIHWTPSPRASYYDVEIYEGGAKKYAAAVLTNTFDWSRTLAEKYGGPWRDFIVQVRAVNSLGATGWTSYNVTNPAPAAPANPAATALDEDSIATSWDPVADLDLHVYRLHMSTAGAGFTPDVGNMIYEGQATSYTAHVLSPDTTYYFKACAIDTMSVYLDDPVYTATFYATTHGGP